MEAKRVCCQIITKFFNVPDGFRCLLETLSEYGDILWTDGKLYFASVSEEKTLSESQLEKIMKEKGYYKFFIDSYDFNTLPKESEYIVGWLQDRLIKINYLTYEEESQKVFHDISKGLDMLDSEIDRLRTLSLENAEVENHE